VSVVGIHAGVVIVVIVAVKSIVLRSQGAYTVLYNIIIYETLEVANLFVCAAYDTSNRLQVVVVVTALLPC